VADEKRRPVGKSSYEPYRDEIWLGVIKASNAAQKLGVLQRIEMERFAGTL